MRDRNKTGLTHDVTAAVSQWLNEHGFKPVETEVPVTKGWCADLAGVIVPTQTELIGLKLLERAPSWNECRAGQVWAAEQHEQWRQRRNQMLRVITCAVEVKTSRSDYRNDRKWVIAQPTDLAYVAVPKGMTKPEEWPAGWGVLEYHDHSLRQVRVPVLRDMPADQQRDVILSIAVRRDHHTRYERFREHQREERKEAAETRVSARVSDVMRLVMDVVRGNYGSFETALSVSRVRRSVPEAMIEELRKMWDMRPLTLEERQAAFAEAETQRVFFEAQLAERRARRNQEQQGRSDEQIRGT